ncbi:hypothetical protein [Oleiharenicola lentus]|uniref:hypothetical protein n=1 Tax=Oleiharenicola lentus TaxID=2508720 RepID=UPI003F66BA53
MKHVELSEAAYDALMRLAAAKNISPADLLTSLLGAERPPLAGDNLLFFFASLEFAAQSDSTARYLALLSWVAKHYACDFADFIAHQDSGRRYLMLSRQEFHHVRTHNHATQIAGTQYWAVLNIDDSTKRRFVCRMLEFIGCHDETIAHACRALGFVEGNGSSFRLLSA